MVEEKWQEIRNKLYTLTEQRSDCVGSQVGRLWGLYMRGRGSSLYSMHSLTLSQWKNLNLMIRVIWKKFRSFDQSACKRVLDLIEDVRCGGLIKEATWQLLAQSEHCIVVSDCNRVSKRIIDANDSYLEHLLCRSLLWSAACESSTTKPASVQSTNTSHCHHLTTYPITNIYSVSQKNPSLRGPNIYHFFHKRLRIFNRFFTHLLYVPMYARLQISIIPGFDKVTPY